MKHTIVADKFEFFVRNIDMFKQEMDDMGIEIVSVKFKMKTVNGDYRGYNRNYSAVYITKRGSDLSDNDVVVGTYKFGV